MSDWYYLKDGEQKGPLDDEALLDAVGNGTIAHTDLIWCEGMGDWQPAAELMEFEEAEGDAAAAAAPAATAAAATAAPAAAAAAAPAASNEAWYYLVNGNQTGPVSLEQLGALSADGTLSSEDLIWTESLGDWKKVSDVAAVASAASGASAAPAAAGAPAQKGVKLGGQKKKTVVRKAKGGKKVVAAASAGAVAVGATAAAAATAAGSSASGAIAGVGATPDNRDGHWVYPGFKWLITSFKGRIPRKKFWIGLILLYVLMLLTMIPAGVLVGLGAKGAAEQAMGGATPSIPVLSIVGGILMFLLALLFMFFSLALQVKRWHDRDKPGWWLLIGMVPVVGIWAFIETGFLEGTVGPNQFGPDPLGRK